MSGYKVEWGCCGDETYTDSWEPEQCPFCEVSELQQQLQQAEARVAELEKQASVTDSLVDNRRSRRWHETYTKEADEAWLLRRQAEIAERCCKSIVETEDFEDRSDEESYGMDLASRECIAIAQRLRQQADELER